MNMLVEKLPYWSSLTEEEKKMVSEAAVLRNYSAGSLLHGSCKGGSCLGMIYVVKGEVRAYIVSEEGREITIFRIREGESCVLSASCIISQISFDTQLTIVSDSEILIVPASVFARLTRSNLSVKCYMYELATARFSNVMWTMQQILFFRFDQRLSSFLLQEYQRTKDPVIHMTQEQIAQNVNSAREVVARMLRQFVSEGILEIRRGVIEIKDIEALEALTE